jgi:hypothetical protein
VQHQLPAGLARHGQVEASGARHLDVEVARDVLNQTFMGGGARLVGKDGPRAVLACGPDRKEANIGADVDDRRPLGQHDLRMS